jgi:hypothetical protein
MSSSRSIAAARSRRTTSEQGARPTQDIRPQMSNQPPTPSNVRNQAFPSDVQTKISVQDAINIITKRISRLEQISSPQQQFQVPENSCVVDNAVLEDIIERLDKLETTQDQTFDLLRREFDSKFETLTRETNEKIADIDLAFAEIEKSIQLDNETQADNTEISSADVAETIQLEISNA